MNKFMTDPCYDLNLSKLIKEFAPTRLHKVYKISLKIFREYPRVLLTTFDNYVMCVYENTTDTTYPDEFLHVALIGYFGTEYIRVVNSNKLVEYYYFIASLLEN